MKSPLVSVIIPTYAGAAFLPDAIRSVLNQTYQNLELIVVDDVSPDATAEVINEFDDPRLQYIVHAHNQGAVAARRTGVHASTGDIIALLDQDDMFHPDKLQVHVSFLEKHPEVGVTYNARFELEQGSKTIRSIWQPPEKTSLIDLILGFPFSPSDTVLRRELALREDVWDQSYVFAGEEKVFNGAEIVMGGRLALAGYEFHSVERALNYRRYHANRYYPNLPERCKAEKTCQEIVLNDPRCPEHVRAVRNEAFMNTYMIWAYYAFSQDETHIGQSFLREAVLLVPKVLNGEPCELVEFMVANSGYDKSVDLKQHSEKILAQFPPEISHLASQLDTALARGYLVKGTQAVFWGRYEEGESLLDVAYTMGAKVDEKLIQNVTFQLLAYRREFGEDAAKSVIDNLTSALKKFGNRHVRSWLKGCYAINCAFRAYQAGNLAQVPGNVFEAIWSDPQYLFNRGALSILLRSAANIRPEARH
jgi:glycosyltransferase involved in cell wall biosynthesis